MPPPRATRRTPDAFIQTPWAGARVNAALLEATLALPIAVGGRRIELSPATAALYTYYLRDIIPHASTPTALLRILQAPTATGLKPARHVLSVRRVAWQRFLATKVRTPWEKFTWPALPSAARAVRPSTNNTFRSWWTSRSLGVGIRWLHGRAKALDIPLKPRDLRCATAASIRRDREGNRFLLIQRAVDLGKTRGEPEVILPLSRADLLVIAAMLHASWGDAAAEVPAERRLLIACRGEGLSAERMGELYTRATTRLFDVEPLCGGAARADAVDYVMDTTALTSAPDPGTPIDLWGSALATVLARIAIRAEAVPAAGGASARVLRFQGARALDIFQAFELVDRVDLTDRTRGKIDVPFDPESVALVVSGANEVLDGVAAKRHRALRERTNAWHRNRLLREDGPLGGADEEDASPGEAMPPEGTAPPPSVTLPPSPAATIADAERAARLQRLIAKRNDPYTPFSKEEKGRVK